MYELHLSRSARKELDALPDSVVARIARSLVYLPGAADRFFLEAGTRVGANEPLPDFDRPADLSGVNVPAVLAIAERHGMRIIENSSTRRTG